MERPQPQRAALWNAAMPTAIAFLDLGLKGDVQGRKDGPFRFHSGASSAGCQSLLCYNNPLILMLGRRLGDAHPQRRIHF